MKTESMERLTACILCGSETLGVACEQNLFCRCGNCGLIFDNPRPTWDAVLTFYSKQDQYDEWLDEEKARDDLWKRRLKRVIRHCPSGRLLDVGAGIGQFLHFAKARFEVEGTEVSTSAIALAEARYGVKLRQGTVETLTWEKPFDALTMFHVLEHVPYPRETLRACYDKLRPGGYLFIAVPNDVSSFLSRCNRWMESRGVKKYHRLGKVGLPRLSLDMSEIHLSHFTPEVLRHALGETGFDVVEDSLDPAFAVQGLRKWRRYRRYFSYGLLKAITGKNLYDTLWITAKKNGDPGGPPA